MYILNLTQHAPTEEQKLDGVIEPVEKEKVKSLLTFEFFPRREEIAARAKALAEVAADHGAEAAMIGGAPYLMTYLERELKEKGIKPLYSFTQRVSEEVTLPSGSVKKTNVFKHIGWVEA